MLRALPRFTSRDASELLCLAVQHAAVFEDAAQAINVPAIARPFDSTPILRAAVVVGVAQAVEVPALGSTPGSPLVPGAAVVVGVPQAVEVPA